MFGPILYGCVEQMHGCVEQMHIISNYIYMMMMGTDGLDGYWMENMCVLMVFWMGLGGVGMFFGSPRIDLMDVGCMLGRFLAGFVDVFRRILDGCLMGL